MSQLCFHSHAVSLTGDAVPQGLAQQRRHIGDGVLPMQVGFSADRLQCIVYEMGIDLGAHQLHFRLGQRQVALVDLFDQVLNMGGHGVEGLDQPVHFVAGPYILHRREVLIEDTAAHIRQLVDGLLNAARDHPHDEQHQRNHQRQQQRQHQRDPKKGIQAFNRRAQAGHIAAGQPEALPDGA